MNPVSPPVGADGRDTNHDDALIEAALTGKTSNLARCYTDLYRENCALQLAALSTPEVASPLTEEAAWSIAQQVYHKAFADGAGHHPSPQILLSARELVEFAALLSHLSARVPQGWKLVPIESTPEMTAAGAATPGMMAINNSSMTMQLRGYPLPREAFCDGSALEQAWRAMLSAAPKSVPPDIDAGG